MRPLFNPNPSTTTPTIQKNEAIASSTKNVYIILTETGTWFSGLIGRFTGDAMNHASISFDPSLKEVYSFGRKNLNNPFDGGLVKENMQSSAYRKWSFAIYKLEVSAAEYDRMQAFVADMMKEQSKYKYNLLGLFGVLLGKPYAPQDRFFCSQFVAAVLEQADRILMDNHQALVKPGDFAASPKLQPLYQGKHEGYFNELSAAPMASTNFSRTANAFC